MSMGTKSSGGACFCPGGTNDNNPAFQLWYRDARLGSCSSPRNFPVGPERDLTDVTIAQGAFKPFKKLKENRRRNRAAETHDKKLPERSPSEKRSLASG